MAKKLNVVFVSGPRYAGKSALIQAIASGLCDQPPHYIRLVPSNGEEPRLTLLGDLKRAGLASWRRVNYDSERIFEFLPESLAEIARQRISPTVLIEADADPTLRYAYPYDHRVFVMPAPRGYEEVFRSPSQAAEALREVMDDTAAFATEIFGLFDPDADEEEPGTVQRVRQRGAVTEERLEITPVQMRRFMNSPLGAEVASRIQLQPDYHSLMESDVIIVNSGRGGSSPRAIPVVQRVQALIRRLVEGRLNRPTVLRCDPLNDADPARRRLLAVLKPIVEP